MSGYSEDDIRRAADIREWLVKQIADKQDEVDRLRTTLSIIDNLLKQGSFRAAASYSGSLAASSSSQAAQAQMQSRSAPQTSTRQSTTVATPPSSRLSPSQDTIKPADFDIRPLKRAKDDLLLANAEVTANSVIITPAPGIILNSSTPPFRSFFIGRIVEGMKNKDIQLSSQGAIKESDALSYSIEEDPANAIKKIVINNYRDKERLTEIFNTSSWVFTRMLEKTGQ